MRLRGRGPAAPPPWPAPCEPCRREGQGARIPIGPPTPAAWRPERRGTGHSGRTACRNLGAARRISLGEGIEHRGSQPGEETGEVRPKALHQAEDVAAGVDLQAL